MADNYTPQNGAIFTKPEGYDDPDSYLFRHTTGPTARNYIDLKTKLFGLLKKYIKGVPTIEAQNMYKIRSANREEFGEGTTPFNLPALTWSIIRAKADVPYDRIRQVYPASEEKGEVHAYGKTVRYIIQFDCWGNTPDEADIVQQRLHDFFDLNQDELIRQAGATAIWLEDLRDMEIRRFELPLQVRSSQYEIKVGHQHADEVINDIDAITVSPGLAVAGNFDQDLTILENQ